MDQRESKNQRTTWTFSAEDAHGRADSENPLDGRSGPNPQGVEWTEPGGVSSYFWIPDPVPGSSRTFVLKVGLGWVPRGSKYLLRRYVLGAVGDDQI